MKKIVYLAAVAASGILVMGGCAKESGNIVPENGGFSIKVNTPGTKTVFDGGTYAVTWESGDELGVVIDNGTESKLYKFTKAAGNTFSCAEFVPQESVSYTYYVLYPYTEGFTVENGVSSSVVNISSGKQSGLDAATHIKTPLYGKATAEGEVSPEVTLNHAAAVIKINVANYSGADLTVSEVGIQSADPEAVMSGIFSLNFETGELTAAETSPTASSVVLEPEAISNESSADFYVAVAPFATENLSVTVNDDAIQKAVTENGFDFKAGYVYTTSVAFDAVSLTQTVEDANVYAALQELNVGEVNLTASVDGTTYYLCPEDGTFNDGVAVSVTRRETAGNGWTFSSADTYRIVYDAADETVTIYSSENEFNTPATVRFNYAYSSDRVLSREIRSGDYYMYVNNGDDKWKADIALTFNASLADPQILVWEGSKAIPQISYKDDGVTYSNGGFNIKVGRLLSHFDYESKGTQGDDPEKDSEVNFTSRVAAFSPGREDNKELKLNEWMEMSSDVSNKKWYPMERTTITKIVLDIRNSRIRVE